MGWDLSLQPLSLEVVKSTNWMNLGAWSWFAEVEDLTWGAPRFYEFYPPREPKVNFRPLARTFGESPRSLEVWWDGELARIIYATDAPASLTPFRHAYPGIDMLEIKETEPAWVKKLKSAPLFFDIEQLHALPYCCFVQEHRGELLDHVIGALEGTGPAWIQIITSAWNFAPFAEQFANAMDQVIIALQHGKASVQFKGLGPYLAPEYEWTAVPSPEEAGSTIAKYGGFISKEAMWKGQLANAIVHVRGLLTDPESLKTLPAAFKAGIRISYDFPELLPYDDPRFLRWLRSRNYPNPEAPLAFNAAGGFLRKWSTECREDRRTLIPVFCAVPPELSIFNCLPTDPELPVRYITPKPPRVYRRPKRRGIEL